MRRRFVRLFTSSALGLAASMPLAAQGATGTVGPLVGTVAPGAIGRPIEQPAPIGGLRTTPISTAPATAGVRGRVPRNDHHRRGGGGGTVEHGQRPGARGWYGVVPLRVVDAPLVRGGAIVIHDEAPDPGIRWLPTADRPLWVVDSLAPRVDAWRDLIVRDVLCTGTGYCVERVTPMRARWSAYCNCYQFADALNRVWRVE